MRVYMRHALRRPRWPCAPLGHRALRPVYDLLVRSPVPLDRQLVDLRLLLRELFATLRQQGKEVRGELLTRKSPFSGQLVAFN